MHALLLLTLSCAPLLMLGPGGHGDPARLEEPSLSMEAGSREAAFPMQFFGNRPVVEVSLDGQGPYLFILDTGAQGSVIDASLATELDLPVIGEQELISPAGGQPIKSSTVQIGTVGVGAITFHDVQAATMDLAAFLRDPNAPRGVLSASSFEGMLLAFEYPRKRITIRPGELAAADGREIFQYEAADVFPTIPISIAGVTIDTHLDTGSAHAFALPGKYKDLLPLASEPKEMGKARLVGREMPILGAPLDGTVEIGRYSFTNPELRFGEFFPVGNIGNEILREFTVTLDSSNRRVRLEQEPGQR
jgi:hypothetical protein